MSYRFHHIAQQVPDIAEAVDWYLSNVPGARRIYEDPTWGLIEAGGVKVAFVVHDQHPPHVAWEVLEPELERLAAEHGKEIITHRDKTRSFYLDAPGGQCIELISVECATYQDRAAAVDKTGTSRESV